MAVRSVTPTDDDEESDPPDDTQTTGALASFVTRLAVWAAVLAFTVVGDPDPTLTLLLIALAGVVTIVTDKRLAWELRLEEHGIPTREAWVPLLMLGLMLHLDLVRTDRIGDVLADKGPVITFILAFALVAEGLRRSGFIHYLAYQLAERGGANTTRLTLYLFLLSSFLTYFTSNDIVVLTMTPIVVSVAYQARIRNAKLLLLSQFIAANTVSMGILIGSPTNLILGRAMDIRFVEYLFLMLAPSVMALMITFVLVTWMNWFVERRGGGSGRLTRWLVGTWSFEPGYTPPHFAEHSTLTREMKQWVGVFTLSVALLTIGTATDTGLLLAALAIAGIGLLALHRTAQRRAEPTGRTFLSQTLRVFPVGIVFFGLTYFVIADAIADTRFVREEVDEYVTDEASSHTPVASWGSMLASGALVNTMNDLPASALTGTVLQRAEFETPFDRALVVQGTLAGLNIATYVTPVGALAGIIWFDILRKERRRRHAAHVASGLRPFDAVVPNRRDLVLYGSIIFLATTAVLGATNFAFVAGADALLGPPGRGSEFSSPATHTMWTVVCLAAVVGVVVAFRRVLAAAGVALVHLGEAVAVAPARQWLARHRPLATALLVGLLLGGGGMLLYWAEAFHAREYGAARLFDGPGEFLRWLGDVAPSGFAGARRPRTTAGRALPFVVVSACVATVMTRARTSLRLRSLTAAPPPRAGIATDVSADVAADDTEP